MYSRQWFPSSNGNRSRTLTIGSPSDSNRFLSLSPSTQCPDLTNVSLVGYNLEREGIISSEMHLITKQIGVIRRHWPNKWRWCRVPGWSRRATLRYEDSSLRRDENSTCPLSIDVNRKESFTRSFRFALAWWSILTDFLQWTACRQRK